MSQPAPSATPAELLELEKSFLRACMAFEPDELSFENATKIRDNTAAVEQPILAGLLGNRPLTSAGLEGYTPLGFAAESLSQMALHTHEMLGTDRDFVPTMAQAQTQMAAAAALRRVVIATLEGGGKLLTSSDPNGDEYQSLHALCPPNDAEFIERCVAGGLELDAKFVARMDIDVLSKLVDMKGAGEAALSAALTDPSTQAEMKEAINRAPALAKLSEEGFSKMAPIVKAALDPVTIDAALQYASLGDARGEVITGLLALGANPLGASQFDPAEPTPLWRCLKDGQGFDGAKALVPHTPNLNETHGGMSLLALAVDRRGDEVVKALADAGAKFATPAEALTALINGAELGLLETIKTAIAQKAGVNDIENVGLVPRTALISAGLHDEAEAVALLLENGADPNLKVRKRKAIQGVRQEVEVGFFDEVLLVDSVNALHAAGEKLGVSALLGLKPHDDSPDCKALLAAVKAQGAIPPREKPEAAAAAVAALAAAAAGGADLNELAASGALGSALQKAQAGGTQIIGVPPGGSLNLKF